jgi:hypothetical protein
MTNEPSSLAGPWRLPAPPGDPAAFERIRQSINAQGHYEIKATDEGWLVERRREPPSLFRELDWKINAITTQGGEQSLIDHLASWPDLGGGDDPTASKLLDDLEAMPSPTDPTRLAEVPRMAGTALMLSSTTQLPQTVARVARALLRWYPVGQMLMWAKDINHINGGRPAHLLAGAALVDIDHVAEGVGRQKSLRPDQINFCPPKAVTSSLVRCGREPGRKRATIPALSAVGGERASKTRCYR